MKGKIVWLFTIMAFLFFYLSLRSNELEVQYALVALIAWGIGFGLNKRWGNRTEKEKEKRADSERLGN